jgi:hypothetical protein
MKRFLLPASALVLVVTACGAGVGPAPRVTEAAAHVPSVRFVVAQRKAAAAREANQLLREFVPPPAAREITQPRDYGGVLRRTGPTPAGKVVDVHRFWSVRKPLAAVAAFVRAHPPYGLEGRGATYGTNVPHYLTWSFSTPARYLNVTAVGPRRRTLIRVDAEVLWVYPRAASEKVPAATEKIVVRAPKVSAQVTDQAEVARIVRWFNVLPVSPPGVASFCALRPGADITVSFRSAAGAWLAQAKLPPTNANLCDPIEFQIGGQAQKPLVDGRAGESLVGRLGGLLGVQLTRVVQ